MSNAVKSKAGGFVAAVGMITVLTALSRVFGFVRWVAQSAWVGSGDVAGAYATANQVPNVIMEVLAGGALTGAIVPLLSLPLAKKMTGQVEKLASALLTWVLIILIPAAGILALCSPWLARAFPLPVGAPAEETYALMTTFLRIFSIQIPLYGIGVVLTGVLQAHKKFFGPALAPILSSIVVIGTYAVYGVLHSHDSQVMPSRSAILFLAWGTTAGVVALSLPLIIPTSRLGLRWRPTVKMPLAQVRHVARLAASGIGALLAQQLAIVVVLALARGYGEAGTVVIFQYTQAVFLLPYAILVTPIVTALYPSLSSNADEVKEKARQASEKKMTCPSVLAAGHRMLWLVTLVGISLLVVAAPWAEAFFSKLTQVDGMSYALWLMAPGMGALGLLLFYTRALFAFDHSRFSAAANIIGWLTVSLSSWILAYFWVADKGDGRRTLWALATGNSIGMVVGAGIGAVALSALFGAKFWGSLRPIFILLVPAAIVSGGIGVGLSLWVCPLVCTSILKIVFAGCAVIVVSMIPVGLMAWKLVKKYRMIHH